MFKKIVFYFAMLFSLTACTTGKLDYITVSGERKTACEIEYTWEPSVDVYIVEYILSYCAKEFAKKGNTIVDKSLLSNNLEVVNPPKGKNWTFELAQQFHNEGKLTDKEYGYLIGYLDLGHDKTSEEN